MEMHQLRYFLSVCDTLHFTRAAERCHVSQPALTKAIKKLEAELGGALFIREGKRVFLSEFGKLVRPNMDEIYRQTETVTTLAENYRLLDKSPLNIGVMTTIGPTVLSRFLADFRQNHLGIEVAISERPLASLVKALMDGEIEIALLHDPSGTDESFRAEPVYREKYVVILPPGHRLAELDGIRLTDVSGEPYVDRLACEMREMVLQQAKEQGVAIYANYRSKHEDWIQGMVLAGMGFAFMPEYSVTTHGLSIRPLIDPPVSRTISLAVAPGRPLSPAGKAFIKKLKTFPWPG